MRKITLFSPNVEGQTVTFRWDVEPATSLYRRTKFDLTFPSTLRLSDVPPRLWWDILLMCLHPHWLLLRPCEVHLPLNLGASLRQFWLQLLQNGADTLELHRDTGEGSDPLDITLFDGNMDIPYRAVVGTGFGTAFSSGKDSLLQAGLLMELFDRPLLVATTSPMPPLQDHVTARRRFVLDAIRERRDPMFVEVISDFRSCWDNSFASQLGYRVSVNELSDTFLYTASLLATGAACGFTRLFVASETEIQDSGIIDGKIIQHFHFMYSAATQRALARLVEPYGVRLSSLTWPLRTMQVQQLLWSRYSDICDLQYSCWRVPQGEDTCSDCEQCLRIAMTALAEGHDPGRMGINLQKVINFAPGWNPFEEPVGRRLPQHDSADLLGRQMYEVISRTSVLHVAKLLLLRRKQEGSTLWGVMQRILAFYKLRERARRGPKAALGGLREAFLEWLDPDIRDRIAAIYKVHFPIEPRPIHAGHWERSCALTLRATSSLATIPKNPSSSAATSPAAVGLEAKTV